MFWGIVSFFFFCTFLLNTIFFYRSGTLTGTNTSAQSGPRNNGNEWINLRYPELVSSVLWYDFDIINSVYKVWRITYVGLSKGLYVVIYVF